MRADTYDDLMARALDAEHNAMRHENDPGGCESCAIEYRNEAAMWADRAARLRARSRASTP